MSINIFRSVHLIIAFNLALLILLGGYFPLSVKILLYLSAFLYTLHILYLILIRQTRKIALKNILTFPAVLFFLVLELSLIFSVNYYQSQKVFFSRFVGYFLAFILGAAVGRERKLNEFLSVFFLVVAFIISLGGLWDYFRFDPARLFTSFGTEIHWPIMLAVYLPLMISVLIFSPHRNIKIPALLNLGLLFLCMLFHGARIVWISLIVVVGVVIGLRKPKWLFGLALIILLTALFSPSAVRARVRTAMKVDTKLAMNRPALEIFEDFPITGAGLGTFESLRPVYDPHASFEYIHTDNTYTEIMAENGMLGLTAFIWIFVVFFREAAVVIKKQREENKIDPIILGLTGGIFAITIINLGTNAVTVGFQNAVIFWVVLGYSSALVSRARMGSGSCR